MCVGGQTSAAVTRVATTRLSSGELLYTLQNQAVTGCSTVERFAVVEFIVPTHYPSTVVVVVVVVCRTIVGGGSFGQLARHGSFSQ